MPRKRGRPPKRGKWIYLVRTGDRSAARLQQFHTDGEVKTALRKFYDAFTADARRLCTPLEQALLAAILADIAALRETPDPAMPQLSSFNHDLRWEWTFQWGGQGEIHACASVERIPDNGPQIQEVPSALL